MGQTPAPPKSIPKTISPPKVRRRKTYNRITALAKHIGKKIRRHLVTASTLKSLETVFA